MLLIRLGIEPSETLFLSSVWLAGFLSFFAPCTFPLLPAYIGMLTDHDGDEGITVGRHRIYFKPFIKTLLFVSGLSTTFITLGFGFGAVGGFINGGVVTGIGGLIVIALGLHQMGVLKLPGLSKYRTIRLKRARRADYVGAYLLGLTFSFGWTPCVGPVLGAVLLVSADGGQALYGALLMAMYALGLMIPFLVMATLSSVLIEKLQVLEKHLDTIKKVGGLLIVLMGVLLLTNQLNTLTVWISKVF